jgi:hypothetical protein
MYKEKNLQILMHSKLAVKKILKCHTYNHYDLTEKSQINFSKNGNAK